MTDWERTLVDNGVFRLPNSTREFRDWSWTPDNTGGQGVVNLHRAIYRSSNVYFYELGSRLPVDALPAFRRAVRLRTRPVHRRGRCGGMGLLPDQEWKMGVRGERWYPGDNVNLSIGQGDLLATPLQLATVAAIIANRGTRGTTANVAAQRRQSSRVRGWRGTGEGGRRCRARRIGSGWWRPWRPSCTGATRAFGKMAPPGPTSARTSATEWRGKSGTAQVVGIAQGEEYNEEELDEFSRKHAWFTAFAPVDDPQIALCVLVENGGSGSSVAGPVAREGHRPLPAAKADLAVASCDGAGGRAGQRHRRADIAA